VGAVLARDKGDADIRSIESGLIAGKHRSHRFGTNFELSLFGQSPHADSAFQPL